MSNPEQSSHPAFDADEQKILSELKPDDGDPADNAQAGQPGDPNPNTAPAGADATAAAAAPAAAAPAAANTDATPGEGAAAAATPGAEPDKPDAVATAQDKPKGDVRAALRASRHAEQRLRDELAEAKQTIEQLKSGDLPTDTNISEEELNQLEADFPAMAKAIRRQQALEREIQALKVPTKDVTGGSDFQPLEYAPQVQMLIDDVPDLLAWQHDPNAQDKFQRAIEYDKALNVDPDWKDKPAVERFAEAARRTREKFGMPATPTPSAGDKPAPKTPVDPKAALDAAPATGPKGISDFRGGSPASSPSLNYDHMSDEAIMASLPAGD